MRGDLPIPLVLLVVAFLLMVVSALIAARSLWRSRSRAENKTEAILEAAVDGVVTMDEKGIIENFNPAAERLFGYRRDEVIGRNVKMLMPEPYQSEHDGYLAAYRVTHRPKVIGTGREVEGRRKDGSTFPMDLAVGESRSGKGRLFAGIVRDITGRKETERRLRQSEEKNRAILETAVDGIITIDDKGVVLTVNAATERIFGYAAEEIVGRNVNVLMPEPYHHAHDGYLRHYLRTGDRKIIGIGREVEGLRKDGSRFPMDLSVGEADFWGRRVFTGIVRDITERKRTEEELRRSEEDLRLLIDNVRDHAITWLDAEGMVVSWNAGAERIYGWSAEEIIGQPMGMFYPPESRPNAQRLLSDVRERGHWELEGWRIRKDGTRFWVQIIINPLWDRQGHMRGFVQVARDITDRKQAEKALHAAKEAAERANIAKSQFLAAASHDMRQPVQALLCFAEALEGQVSGTPAAAILGDLKGSLDALNALLESLLDVSRLEAGIVAVNASNYPLKPLFERMVAEFSPMAAEKGLELTIVPTSVIIRTDPALFGRMVQNLLANAIRYTSTGRVVLGARKQADRMRIEVWDTGIGIPNDRFEDIFQEFVQIGNPERDRTKGLGLGLAIVQRLAALMDHPVSVRSQEGKGSVFDITVPLVGFDRPQAVSYLNAPPQPSPGKRAVVLIIDDEVIILKGLQMLVESWDYDVMVASSEEEAMALLFNQPHAPDIILADYRLRAGHTGAQAIRHIRSLYRRVIPSIIITGDTDPKRLKEAEAYGLRLLHKPVQPSLLRQVIAEHMA